jgi:hypothetical protein
MCAWRRLQPSPTKQPLLLLVLTFGSLGCAACCPHPKQLGEGQVVMVDLPQVL